MGYYSLPPKPHCISMPVWSSVLAAITKSHIQNEGSKTCPAQGAKNLQGHGSSSYKALSVPTLHEKIIWAAGKVARLISSCCHPFLAPAWAAVHRGLTMGAPWEIWKLMHLLPAAYLPGHWLRSSPAEWDQGQPQQKTFRSKSAAVRH